MPRKHIINSFNTSTINVCPCQPVTPPPPPPPPAPPTAPPEDTQSYRERLRAKLYAEQHLTPAAEEYTQDKPPDLDTHNMNQHAQLCIATWNKWASWAQRPEVHFERQTRRRGCSCEYKDAVRFNDPAIRAFNLQHGLKIAVFSDGLMGAKYVVFQNVVRTFEAPAHIHRFGAFHLVEEYRLAVHANGRAHVVRPETHTRSGMIGHSSWNRYPLGLFHHLPWLLGHYAPLYQIKGMHNLLLVSMANLIPVPMDMATKMTRQGDLVPDSYRRGVTEADIAPVPPGLSNGQACTAS